MLAGSGPPFSATRNDSKGEMQRGELVILRAMSNAPILQVEDLEMTFGRSIFNKKKGFRALRGVSLEVGRGKAFGLLGPNGAGKTTLIKILLGLAHGYNGKAMLFGEQPGNPASRSRVGYLPETHRLPGYLTGRQVVTLFGMLCGRSKEFIAERIDPLLDRVGMLQSCNRKVGSYSKGMQQANWSRPSAHSRTRTRLPR